MLWQNTSLCRIMGVVFNVAWSSIKEKVVEHILRYGNQYYKQFKGNNFPSGPFFMFVIIIIGGKILNQICINQIV